MSVADRSVRTIVVTVVALVLCAFAALQLASDSLYATAAAPGSFPSRIPPGFGVRIYRALDRVAPAPYVEATLAREALGRGDLDAAARYAVRMPATATRNGLLEAIAARRGQPMLAFEYAFAAPDIAGVQGQIERLKARDPRRAYVLEERFRDRLVALSTHPDAVAHSWWMLGTIASSVGGRSWLELAYADYAAAAALAPLDLTNVLGAANQAVTLHDWAHAEHWYRHAIDVNPATADGIAGLGIVALNARADRRAAQRYLAQARTADPSAPLVRELQRELALP